jgi:serine kinase of HPr protein (carbohydrate metabolism regulator)
MGPSPLVPQPAELVADDQVRLERVGNRLRASAPAAIAGKLEVRGIGILTLPAVPAADVVVLVELVAAEKVERMPGPNSVATILGLELPILRLAPAEPSAPAKLLVALATELGRSTPSGRAVEENPCVCCEPL